MNSVASQLIALLIFCAGVGGLFGLLWYFGRPRRLAAEWEALKRLQQARAAERSLHVLQERCTEAEAQIQRLHESAARDRAESEAMIEGWSRRFGRIAHWEGVEGHREKERELRETIAVLESAIAALRNVVNGYGSRYVVPPQSVLDEIAQETGYSDPGRRLKDAREKSRRMVRDRVASTSDYPEADRARLAADLVLEVFHAKSESILGAVKDDNIGTLRQKLRDAFTLVNEQGVVFRNARVLPEYLDAKIVELKWAARVQQVLREQREEQRRIKERMREEAKVQRELERAQREALKKEESIVRERAAIREARDRAEFEERSRYEARLREELARASESERVRIATEFQARMEAAAAKQRAEFEARLAETDRRLAEALAERERAKSMAQQTRRGTVYVISNVGSFGEGVYKIGQTRRIDQMERIWELSDASVPFDFDVHALIPADDAPGLEGVLHRRFVLSQVNKVNWRKEFFRVPIEQIRSVVETLGFQAQWTMTAAAQQFYETQALEKQLDSDADFRARWVEEQSGADFSLAAATEGDEADSG